MILRRRRIKRVGSEFRFHLAEEETELIVGLLGQLSELLNDPGTMTDDRLRRVFPTAYPDDPERDAEYQRFMREELVASHLGSVEVVQTHLAGGRLDEAQFHRFVQALNAVRLVIGTLLDVSEDDDETRYADPDYALYGYLSGLLDEAITALQS
ncbi:MAG: DUF2017 family protein [Ilumatobacteraceae bacterium]